MSNLMNICMIGHGMMGVWHSEALQGQDCCLHTLVGRRPEPSEAFAAEYGYRKWTVDFNQALADPEIDIVIIAGPSETHAQMAIATLQAGKHCLVEIPIAMSLEESERIVALAADKGLTLGVVHPMRYRRERQPLLERIARGEERVSHVHGRFFIHRLVNVGATGYQRSWVDNILWHHSTHLLDLGLLMVSGGDMANVGAQIRDVQCHMPRIDPRTGIPMEIVLVVTTHDDQSIVCTGSYYGRERLYDTLVLSDQNSYRVDELASSLATQEGVQAIESERENAWHVARDFVAAVAEGREPLVPGWSVLPTMRLLQKAQAQWDARHGRQLLPGRPVC